MNSSFSQVKIIIGQIISAIPLKRPGSLHISQFWILGKIWARSSTSPQLAKGYIDPAQLVGNLAVGILNFPRRLVAGFRSEVLILGFYVDELAVKLMQPDCHEEQLIGHRGIVSV